MSNENNSISLGISVQTNRPYTLKPKERISNMIVFAPVANYAAKNLLEASIRHDIQQFKLGLKKKSNYSYSKQKDEDISHLLNGLVFLNNNHDQSQAIQHYCTKQGIPKDQILIIDPANPDSKSLDIFQLPVKNTYTILKNLIINKDDFLYHTSEMVLQEYLLLLKLVFNEEHKTVHIEDLISLFDNNYHVLEIVKQLDKQYHACQAALSKLNGDSSHYDKLVAQNEERDETIQWFKQNINKISVAGKPLLNEEGPNKGQPQLFVLCQEVLTRFAKRLKNLAENNYLYRTLFSHSNAINLGTALTNGAIILISSAKTDIGSEYALKFAHAISTDLMLTTLSSLDKQKHRNVIRQLPLFPVYVNDVDYISNNLIEVINKSEYFHIFFTIMCQSPLLLLDILHEKSYDFMLSSIFHIAITAGLTTDEIKFLNKDSAQDDDMFTIKQALTLEKDCILMQSENNPHKKISEIKTLQQGDL